MKTKDAYDGVVSGLADVAVFMGFQVPGRFDRIEVVSLPMLFTSAEAGSRAMWDIFNKFPQIQEQWKDVKMLTMWIGEPHFFIASKKLIKTKEDFSGMKMRTNQALSAEMLKLLGASPVIIPMPDVYENLQKGVVDGATMPAEAMVSWKLYEVASNITEVRTIPPSFQLIMNKQVWESLPKDVQDQIMSVSGEYQAIRFGAKCNDAAWTALPGVAEKAGYKLNIYKPPKEEVDRWKAAVQPLYTTWVNDQKNKGLTNAQEIVDYAIQAAAKYNK